MDNASKTQSNASITLLSRLSLRVTKKRIVFTSLILFLVSISLGSFWFYNRYKVANKMVAKLQELSNAEYPANPALLSKNYQRYSNRQLTIIKRDDTHFDFVLEPKNETTAKIVIKNIDLKLLVPKTPEWLKKDKDLALITLIEREWNRQQVTFPANSENIEISGGDGFEQQNLTEIALTNNCLNAGFWEIALFTKEDSNKTLYYQGWFDFPIGHYKNIFENANKISYWDYWWRLEHWQEPSGAIIKNNLLRNVIDEKVVLTNFPLDEKIISSGEQSRKVRTTLTKNLTTWRDFYSNQQEIQFATFRSPGFYHPEQPWNTQYWRIGKFEKATLRNIKPTNSQSTVQEIELLFRDTKTGEKNRLFIGGINLKDLPKLAISDYTKGLSMPLGISLPPFFQSYEDLQKNHPDESPFFSFLVDAQNRWINHHQLGVDGSIMHLDKDNPNLLHLYLLSYERNTLIAHFLVNLE
ncbi:hypothetical protein NIES37_61260 [Tolypothrix tenuis PCC 7101]|uniref:Uncharacterized protein n=1 Tax=Tolypothrix tenuis PCC 7101 TaxID=231146 RepID=A0A1Z4N8R6_9CYAN|nr:hypothetical protein [Aulosira sp. FACHB-113]BAZ02118.1 hypothetical protein NIES37_61260 [Tolypothrix tenuis PCC 7101]BAZ73961.1 hypothetical protein NIES50_25310 [Aulosira laxa NIES-50]